MNKIAATEVAAKRLSRPATMVCVIGAVGVAIIVISCATLQRVIAPPPEIPGAKFVGMDTCALCHEKLVKDFKLAPHARMSLPGEGARVEGQQGCEMCHGAGSLHVDAGTAKFIVNPRKDPEGCFRCHLEKSAEFSLPFHHPVKEGKLSCTACHDPHGADIHKGKGLFLTRVNDTCASCHREQSRPHVFEHEALREGCSICHNVHGSINSKMLTERDNNLCLKCHAQVALPNTSGTTFIGKFDHTPFLRQGTCFSAGCHDAVHGSDVNSHLRY